MAKVRVYELAKELGVESKMIMEKLGELGEFVRSPSSTIEPHTVRKLRDMNVSATPPWPRGRAHPDALVRQRASRASQKRSATAPASRRDLEAAQEVFGASAVKAVTEGGRGGGIWADGYGYEWQKRFIEHDTFEKFLAVGVGPNEPQLAADCLQAKLPISELSTRLGDRTVLAWLRDGHPPAGVKQTLADCRSDPKSAHLVQDGPVW